MTRVVMLRPEVLDPDSGDDNVMREHGMLWVYVGSLKSAEEPADILHWYRSIATGHEHMWYDHEIEEHNHAET